MTCKDFFDSMKMVRVSALLLVGVEGNEPERIGGVMWQMNDHDA